MPGCGLPRKIREVRSLGPVPQVLHFVVGDLFESPAQTLVNTVNTVGVMGKGIALRFKEIYPDMFDEYRRLCETKELTIGRLHVWRTAHKVVLNFPTKTTWRQPSEPRYIRAGLETFARRYGDLGITSVAFPPLGCGNGELDFSGTVRPIMEEYLSDLPINVFIYAPLPRIEQPEHRAPTEVETWLRGSPGDLSFAEVQEDLRRLFTDRREIPALSGRSSIEVQVLDLPTGHVLRVWSAGRVTSLSLDQVADIWKELRVRPMLTATDAPSDRDQTSRFVFAVLAQLPYVRSIAVGENYDSLRHNPTRALYLVRPEVRPNEQLGLRLA